MSSHDEIGPWYYESDGERNARTYYLIRRNPYPPFRGTERKDFPNRAAAEAWLAANNETALPIPK